VRDEQALCLKVNSSLAGVAMTQGISCPSIPAGTDPAKPPVVLLHGSGGNERDLLPLAAEISPRSPTLAIRGAVPFDAGAHPFIDSQIARLTKLISPLVPRHWPISSWPPQPATAFTRAPVAIGFSNGAIMAAALLLTRPSLLAGAILLRPLSPFTYDPPTQLNGKSVLIIDGEKDTRRSSGDGARLTERLIRAGATMTHLGEVSALRKVTRSAETDHSRSRTRPVFCCR
jgi:phospholipase/carboxylesterase